MSLRGKKLGLLLSTRPETPNFLHAINLAGAALDADLKVYLYCIDDAVHGVGDAQLQVVDARQNQYVSRAMLYKAVGGGF